MDERLKKGLYLMATAILIEVISGVITLFLYVIDHSSAFATALAYFNILLSVLFYILALIGLIMIFTRRKTLGKKGRYATWALILLIIYIIVVLAVMIIGAITIFTRDPKYFTISMIGSEVLSAVMGTLVLFLPIYPLVKKGLRRKIKYAFAAIVLLSLLAQPFAYVELKKVEESFEEDFSGRYYSYKDTKEAEKKNSKLTDDLTGWYMNASGSDEIQNLMIYNSLPLIPYAYIGMKIFLFARRRRKEKRKPSPAPFPYPDTEGIVKVGERERRRDRTASERCRYCGADLMPGIDFCPSCGAYLKE